MDASWVLRRRLATQRLSSAPLRRAGDVVRLLTCVQSQERDHAFFSLGMRSRADTYAAVLAEHDRGAFLRTHILRPTWHFVAPEDLRWILALTSSRVEPSMAARHRQLGLDDPRVVGAALELLAELLRDHRFRTRAEIGVQFAERGSPVAAGQQLGHVLLLAELRGLVCSGPTRGGQHTYALVDEVVPPGPSRTREESLVELVLRFFAGPGPASVKDFCRWSSLTQSDCRSALAEVGDRLESAEVDGQRLWWDPDVPARTTAEHPAYLLPVYDEVTLTYPLLDFPVAQGHPAQETRDPFWAPVVVGHRNVGLWKRAVTGSRVRVEAHLAPGCGRVERAAVGEAAGRLAGFLEKEPELVFGDGSPQLWNGPRAKRR